MKKESEFNLSVRVAYCMSQCNDKYYQDMLAFIGAMAWCQCKYIDWFWSTDVAYSRTMGTIQQPWVQWFKELPTKKSSKSEFAFCGTWKPLILEVQNWGKPSGSYPCLLGIESFSHPRASIATLDVVSPSLHKWDSPVCSLSPRHLRTTGNPQFLVELPWKSL